MKAHNISKVAELSSKLGALKQNTGWDQILDALSELEKEGVVEFPTPYEIALTGEGHRRAFAYFD